MRRTSSPPPLPVLLLIAFAGLLTACGGGGGGLGDLPPGFDPTPPIGPTPPTPGGDDDPGPLEGRLLWDGPTIAEVGRPFEALLFPGGAETLPVLPSLAVAPDGMTFDADTLTISWTPAVGQEGVHAVEIVQGVEGFELGRERYEVFVTARRLEARAYVECRLGARLDVTDAGSTIQGAVVDLPPGALAQDATIELYDLAGHPDLPRHTTYVELLPSQTFLAPVTLTLPYSDDFLELLDVVDERHLAIYTLDEETGAWEKLDSVVVPARSTVTATTTHFSRFAVWLADVEAMSSEMRQQTRGLLAPLLQQSAFTFDIDLHKTLIEMTRPLVQPRRLFRVGGRGDALDGSSSYALVVHGLLSNHEAMSNLITYASARYDHVFAYEYPSGGDIEQNGLWLARHLRQQLPEHARIDVYAHSMGGLVSRYMIEQFGAYLMGFNIDIVNAVFLGTPHTGADVAPLGTLFDTAFEYFFHVAIDDGRLPTGIQQLYPYDHHYLNLNREPAQGWTHYWLIAGHMEDSTSDGWVGLESAAARLFDPTNTTYWTFSGQAHSQLHIDISSNGVGYHLDRYMQRDEHGDAEAIDGVEVTSVHVSVGLRGVETYGVERYEYTEASVLVDIDLGAFRMVPGTLLMVTLDADCGGPDFRFYRMYVPKASSIVLPPDFTGASTDRYRYELEHTLPADSVIRLRASASFGSGEFDLCSGDTPGDLSPWSVDVQIVNPSTVLGSLLAPSLNVWQPAYEIFTHEDVVLPSYR